LIWLAWHTPWLGLNHGPRPVLAAGLVLMAAGLAWLLYRLVDPAAKARVSRISGPKKRPLALAIPRPSPYKPAISHVWVAFGRFSAVAVRCLPSSQKDGDNPHVWPTGKGD